MSDRILQAASNSGYQVGYDTGYDDASRKARSCPPLREPRSVIAVPRKHHRCCYIDFRDVATGTLADGAVLRCPVCRKYVRSRVDGWGGRHLHRISRLRVWLLLQTGLLIRPTTEESPC